MKTEDLKTQGLTEDQIAFVMAENGKDVNKVVAERDNYKAQYETAQTALKGFEGVDIEELQGKISQLTTDLATKDQQYQNKLDDMTLTSTLEERAKAAGARNPKAIISMLDREAIKSSKNRDADIQTAIDALKKSDSYAFADVEVPRVVGSTPGTITNSSDKKSQANEAFRSLLGRSN